MRKKLIIWGTGKTSVKCESILDNTKCEVIAYLESNPKLTQYQERSIYRITDLDKVEFDYLIVASAFAKEIEKTILNSDIGEDKVLYWIRTTDRIKIIELFGRPLSLLPIQYQYYVMKPVMPYQVCSADGCNYIFPSEDDVVSRLMLELGETFAKDDIEFLFNNVKKENGIFLDIGAHIGTTSIFIKKCINPHMEVISFEPLTKNNDMLRINTILNHCEDIKVEKYGVSNTCSTMYMKENKINSGASCIVDAYADETEQITCITLDKYIEENKIPTKKIKYIWIDVEGHEPYVIEGARETLELSDASLFMEYNPSIYIENDNYDGIIKSLKSIYQCFSCVEQSPDGRAYWRSINELDSLASEMQYGQCNILLKK